jgi:hypothetical protein
MEKYFGKIQNLVPWQPSARSRSNFKTGIDIIFTQTGQAVYCYKERKKLRRLVPKLWNSVDRFKRYGIY